MDMPPDSPASSTDATTTPPTPTTTPNDAPAAIEVHRVRFHATAGEYFKIWIVNLALTIVTLGIYSAWAKVRTRKYLDGNIEIAGSRFDYHADPIKILKGRILIAVLFLGYSLGGKISPFIAAAFGLAFMALFPWILVRALIFALTNTSYRGIRFGFERDYKGSYIAYAKGLAITIVTLGLGGPYAAKLHMDFRLNRTRYGNTQARFFAPTGVFFKIFYIGYALMLAGVLAFAVFMLLIIAGAKAGGGDMKAVAGAASVIGVLVMYAGFFLGGAYIRSHTLNLMANQTKLGPVEFRSDLKFSGLAWIYFTNLLACSFTLGLMIPWAVIRTMKYRFDHSQVHAPVNAFEQFQAENETGSTQAAADAAVDFWDIDLGF